MMTSIVMAEETEKEKEEDQTHITKVTISI